MVRIGARGKVFVASLALIVLSLLAAEKFLLPSIDHALTDHIRGDLYVRLAMVVERAASQAPAAPDWDALADRLGPTARARVTFVRADGLVTGDSEVAAAQLAALENHRVRPEIASAFAGRADHAIRYSATTQQRMLYVAAPVPGANIVARLSLTLAAVDESKARVRALLAGGAAVALVTALLFAAIAAVVLSRGLRALTAVARRMAAGDLEARTRLGRRDELGELGRTLDHLAENLSRSLRELRNDRDLLGRILESMREGVLVMDGDRRIVLANASLRDMLLLDSDVAGRSTIEVIRNAELQAMVDHALARQAAMTGEIEVAGLKPRRLLVHATALSGEPRALLLVLFDVTEMRRLETVRRDFVANVSHELRTPIASVCSAAETLRTAVERDPKAAAQFIDMIERNGRRLADLIGDLLDLSRIEANELALDPQPLDLAELCQHAMAPFAERAALRQVKLESRIPAGLPRATGDARAVDRVLANLIDNALKYCPEGARVWIDARETDAMIEVQVSNTGPGIDGKHLPRLFERFYRVDPGRSRNMGGTGLGLSIVKHLVESMGGEVGVESTLGEGATFRFSLPRARP